MEVELLWKLDDRISIIDTMALGKPGVVAAYLVSGKERALIDMGYRSSAQTVINELEDNGIGTDGIDYLLPTHVHLDHSGGCGTLAEKYVNASIRVHPKGLSHLADPTRLWEGAGELFGARLMEQFGKPQPIERNRLREVNDNEEISLGRRSNVTGTLDAGTCLTPPKLRIGRNRHYSDGGCGRHNLSKLPGASTRQLLPQASTFD